MYEREREQTYWHYIHGDRSEEFRGIRKPRPAVNLKLSTPNVCIFCGKTYPHVKFRKDAHVMPAGLGNNTYFNIKRECDTCNELFSTHENELVSLLTLDRIFARGSKRKANEQPKFKKVGGESYLSSTPGGKEIQIGMHIDESDIEVICNTAGYGRLKAIRPAFKPVSVCKALGHMAWSFFDEAARKRFSHIQRWLVGAETILPLYLDRFFVSGNGMKTVALELWVDMNNPDYPIVVRYYYGFHLLQLFIPSTPNPEIEPEEFVHGFIDAVPDKPINRTRFAIPFDGKFEHSHSNFQISFKDVEFNADGSIRLVELSFDEFLGEPLGFFNHSMGRPM